AAVLFFFSSRRRHTRWPRDWSSDVCSSDLEPCTIDASLKRGAPANRQATARPVQSPTAQFCRTWRQLAETAKPCGRLPVTCVLRSEERRVGKECRSRLAANQSKKKN